MGKLKNLLIDTAEDEEFNRIERESKQRKEAVLQALHDENERLGLYKDAYGTTKEQLMAEVAVLTELVRVLSDRVAQLEKPWAWLTNGEMIELSEMKLGSWDLILEVEAKLKEKNNG